MSARRGFALLAVLWATVAFGVLLVALSLAVREAQATARNRIGLARAAWVAEGCAERARAAIGAALADDERSEARWQALDSVVAASALTAGCELRLRATGTQLDVNAADGEQLRALLAALGIGGDRADSVADAILDWRDADDLARPRGAERAWYERAGRPQPRNGPFLAARELRRVRGVGAVPGLDTLLGVESGRVSLARAPIALVASLPGFGQEAVARVVEQRLRGQAPSDLLSFAATLSPAARARLTERYAELVRLTTAMPDGWVLTSIGRSGTPPLVTTLELLLVRSGPRAAVVRRRSWP